MKLYLAIASFLALGSVASSRIRHNRAVAKALEHQSLGARAKQIDDPSSWAKWFCLGAAVKVSTDSNGAQSKTDTTYSDVCILFDSSSRGQAFLGFYKDKKKTNQGAEPEIVLSLGPTGQTPESDVLPDGMEPQKCSKTLLARSQCLRVAGHEFERGKDVATVPEGRVTIRVQSANGGILKSSKAKGLMRVLALAIGMTATDGVDIFKMAAGKLRTDVDMTCIMFSENAIDEHSSENSAVLVVVEAIMRRIAMEETTDEAERSRLRAEILKMATVAKAAAKAKPIPNFVTASNYVQRLLKHPAHELCADFVRSYRETGKGYLGVDLTKASTPNLQTKSVKALATMCTGGTGGTASPAATTAAMKDILGGSVRGDLSSTIVDTSSRIANGVIKVPRVCGAVKLDG